VHAECVFCISFKLDDSQPIYIDGYMLKVLKFGQWYHDLVASMAIKSSYMDISTWKTVEATKTAGIISLPSFNMKT
jgi:hypothetical protein